MGQRRLSHTDWRKPDRYTNYRLETRLVPRMCRYANPGIMVCRHQLRSPPSGKREPGQTGRGRHSEEGRDKKDARKRTVPEPTFQEQASKPSKVDHAIISASSFPGRGRQRLRFPLNRSRSRHRRKKKVTTSCSSSLDGKSSTHLTPTIRPQVGQLSGCANLGTPAPGDQMAGSGRVCITAFSETPFVECVGEPLCRRHASCKATTTTCSLHATTSTTESPNYNSPALLSFPFRRTRGDAH